MSESLATLQIDVYLTPEDRHATLRRDAKAGLTSIPKRLPPKWFYDERGSILFEEITRLPEYYLTRRERSILAEHADLIARLTEANTLVELGSGTSEKTRLLLDALASFGNLRRFVPFDVSEAVLRESALRIATDYPGIEVHAIVGDLDQHLTRLPEGSRRLVAFLGSSIGNLTCEERARFLTELRSTLVPGEGLLLGTDLLKDVERLEAAYNDSAGITSEFNRNVLNVLNQELRASFVVDRFEHVSRFEPERELIATSLRSLVDQAVPVADLDLVVAFGAGEDLHTEISDKFRREALEAELAVAGFELHHWWTDPAGDFAVSLSFAAD